jgi:sugar lactone lactonase YvrE
MVFDAKNGRLISLQTEPGFTGPRVVWPRGKEAILADNYQGKPFGRPNDIVADRNGGVYFTDIPPDRNVIPAAVYYVPPGGAAIRVAEGITTPNGLQLSHDEKTLYVNDTAGINIYALGVQPDGRLANRRVFATDVGRDQTLPPGVPPRSNAHGLVTDDDGRLYALTESGIEVLSPTGQHLGVIPLWCITRRCQNLGFGGPDKHALRGRWRHTAADSDAHTRISGPRKVRIYCRRAQPYRLSDARGHIFRRHRLRKQCAVIGRRRQHRRPDGHRFAARWLPGYSWSRLQAP